MKTIIAFSDTHSTPIPEKLLSVIDEANYVFFLGDGASALGRLLFKSNVHIVQGNCDVQGILDVEKVIEIEGVRILITHGDRYKVKRDLLALAMRAKELNCTCAFYGHTHISRIDEYNGVTLICPGSPIYPVKSNPSYAFAAVHNGNITAKIVNI